jgi:predicted nuclease of predicted toxin-antitoxin system
MKSLSRSKELLLTGILLDENVPNNVRQWLVSKGLKAVSVSEIDLKGSKDYTVAEYAVKNGLTILTLDSDFAHIYHTLKKGTLSVIVLKAHPATASNILQTLIKGSRKVNLQNVENKLVMISQNRLRIIT